VITFADIEEKLAAFSVLKEKSYEKSISLNFDTVLLPEYSAARCGEWASISFLDPPHWCPTNVKINKGNFHISDPLPHTVEACEIVVDGRVFFILLWRLERAVVARR
jgi:hypothetical protein